MPKTLGLVADPVVVAETVERTVTDIAARLRGDWHVRVDEQTFTAGQELRELSQRAEELADEHGWDAVIGLTDLPMVVDGEIVLADVSPRERVAVLSVPALGPLPLRRRLRRAVVKVAEALEGGGDRRVIRISRGGHVRLMLGMVAANHPVRLIRNLTSAGAAALAATAIALMNSNVWLLSDRLAPLRMAAVLLLSVAIMVGWLIVHYDLWEAADDEEEGILPAGRKRAALFNAATVLTLAAGVIALYALLLAVALASAALVIENSVFASTLGHGVSASDYVELAVFATSIGLVGGALGSGFESQDAVRRVAFGVRERHRREKAHAKPG
ncbi:hypothetical protein VSS74_02215 [Conexibacter stalactiti]|uniref:Uncharacterized protein n=1 Tax=Conexibacter stalactiti TaxID=1940611 RepID=A0ABU4HM66_9ACTN|nr:hypothetical protein [Conexibacter stalactiti]MDW5593134.1 hypothetical protein [Conexibacter stalactiti]MEC5033775.1 hypothetical protein [Conexibacter stalactiti]